jgi:glycosyltransferase involved in cell wall biosynthesis
MANVSVCICALARDCAPALSKNLSVVDTLCARFKTANVVIVENDSKDDSKEILRAWAAERPHIQLLLDDFGTKRIPDASSTTFNPSFSRYRIEKLAFHRNRYLDHVATLPDLDYVIVIDLDLYRIDIDGIAQAFGQTIPWDAQFANGRISDPCRPELGNFYYDTYALWELGDSDPQTETKITGYWKKLQPLTKGMPLFAVQSAYGGLGIYRWEALKGQRYGVEDNPGDSRVEVITEHVYLHRRMIEAGNGRLFINPSMVLFYNKPRSGIALRVEKVTSRLTDQGFAKTAQKIARKMVPKLVQE